VTLHIRYGTPPAALVESEAGAVQTSPFVPGATLLEDVPAESAARVVMVVPPGTLERRYALALALRALSPGGTLVALGPKDKGGARIRKELAAFGCVVAEDSKNHWRICHAIRPADVLGLEAAIADGAPRFDAALELWTQPGIFSWDRIDEGSALLLDTLPALKGHGADLGCGLGLLSRAVLAVNAAVTAIEAIELDARALAAARRNVGDERASFHWHDVREAIALTALDFVVMNPPFHAGGADDVGLGRAFLQRARAMLRKGGVLWLVANRHLPYEADLGLLFAGVEQVRETGRFKIVRATA
jgi:16S rRNA (guanine1207-N2)-methyltransferase